MEFSLWNRLEVALDCISQVYQDSEDSCRFFLVETAEQVSPLESPINMSWMSKGAGHNQPPLHQVPQTGNGLHPQPFGSSSCSSSWKMACGQQPGPLVDLEDHLLASPQQHQLLQSGYPCTDLQNL